MNIEEPDARTAALGRGQEYLYGFKPSDLPQELLDQVEAAGEETRKLAYVRWALRAREICFHAHAFRKSSERYPRIPTAQG